MQVTETLSEGLRRSFAVTVPAADIERQAQKKLADLSKTLRLPGFRPGKVPLNLVRKRYGGSVLAEVLQSELDRASDQVIQERGLRPAGQPRIALTGEAPKLETGEASDLSFSLDLDLLPEITVPDLAALALERLSAAPDPGRIDEALARIAAQQGSLEDIADRGADAGDRLVVDFVGRVDGIEFEGGSAKDVTIEVNGPGFIPGFTEQLEGLRPGESRTIQVTFPEGYGVAELAGKPAEFAIEAKALKRLVPAAVEDALGERLGFGNLAELREAVQGQMQRELDQLGRLRIKRQLLDALAERADFPAPQNLVEAEFAAIWQRVEADRAQGREDEEDRGKDEATLKAEYRAIADRRVRLGLLLSEIGRRNSIQVQQGELQAALRQEASRYPGQEMQVVEFFRKNPGAFEQLRGPIFEDKVVDFILGAAQVTVREVTPEALAEAAAEAGASELPSAASSESPSELTAEPAEAAG